MFYLEGLPWPEADRLEDMIQHPSEEFNLCFDEAWLDTEWSRRVISDIQRIDVRDSSKSVIDILAPYGLTPFRLATGTKNLLLCKYGRLGRKCRLSMMGENCLKYLMEIADVEDIHGVCTNVVGFTRDDIKDRPVMFVNTGKLTRGYDEFLEGPLDYIGRGVWDY